MPDLKLLAVKSLPLLLGAFTLLGASPAWAAQASSVVNALEAAPPADTQCRIIQAVQPQFPARMFKNGVTHGAARVLVHVDATGNPADLLVTAYTHRPFADEALRAIGKWRFEPARINGELLDTILDLTFKFELTGVVLVQKFPPEQFESGEVTADYEYQACRLNNLDRMPTPLNVVHPTYPEIWEEQGITGRVPVDFYIDETGRTRFATAAPGTNHQLAGIAVAAVQQWRFDPPTSNGRRVLVHARQIFTFGQKTATPSPGSADENQ